MTTFFFIWTLFLGTVYGGFLGVLVYRLPRGLSLLTSTTRCPKCGDPLRWLDNLPLIGYVLVGGRCRSCRVSISLRYPFLELASVVTLATLFLKFRFFVNEPKALDSVILLTLWHGFYLLFFFVVICVQSDRRQLPLGFWLVAVFIGVLGAIIPEHWLPPQCLPEVWLAPQRFYLATLVAISTAHSIGTVMLISCMSNRLWDVNPIYADVIIVLLTFLFIGWLVALFLLILGSVMRFACRGKFPWFSMTALTGSFVWVLAV